MTIGEAIDKAREKVPLEKLMITLGYGHCFSKKLVKAPWREEEKNGSFHVIEVNGLYKWKDFGIGEKAGDEIDFIAKLQGTGQKEARDAWFRMARVEWPPPRPKLKNNKKTSDALAKALETLETAREAAKFDWEVCVRVFDDTWVKKLAEWRGYRPEFVQWLVDEGMIGVWNDRFALPVHDNQGNVINVHYKDEENDWLYLGGGRPVTAWEIGDVKNDAKPLTLFESEWDALAFLNALKVDGMPEMLPPVAVTRSCSATDLIQELLIGRTRGDIIAFCQNDPPAKEGEKNGNEKWTEGLMDIRKGIRFTAPPEGIKDLNDWIVEGAKPTEVLAAVELAEARRSSNLSVRNIEQLLEMEFDGSDNYLGDRMLQAGALVSFLGPGGVGKSRMVLQMAVSCILGEPFLGIESHCRGKKWLIVQNENSNRRLSHDLRCLQRAFDLTGSRLSMVKRCLSIHTVETIDAAYMD